MKQRDEVSVLEKKDRHRQNRRNQLTGKAQVPNTHYGLFLRGPFTVSVSPVCVGCRDHFGRGAGGRKDDDKKCYRKTSPSVPGGKGIFLM